MGIKWNNMPPWVRVYRNGDVIRAARMFHLGFIKNKKTSGADGDGGLAEVT